MSTLPLPLPLPRNVWHRGCDRFSFPVVRGTTGVDSTAWRQPGMPDRPAVLATRATFADYQRAAGAASFAKAFKANGQLRKGWRMIGGVPTYDR
jgi:hypothetical protein